MYKSDIFHLFFIFSRFGRPILTGIDGFGCFFEERCVQGNGKGVSRNLWKINSYEGKIEIIRRSRKENARYLDLLCSDTIWKRGREKVEPSHWLILSCYSRSFPRVFFFPFFSPSRTRESGRSGSCFESSFFLFFFSPVVLSFQAIFTPRPGIQMELQAILMAEIMIEHYGNGI